MNMMISVLESVVPASDGYDWMMMIIVAVVIGLIVGLIYALVLRGQLTSVYKNDTAADYTREKSFKVEVEREVFLYSKTEKEEKPNSTESSEQ